MGLNYEYVLSCTNTSNETSLNNVGQKEPKSREAQETRDLYRTQSSTTLAGGGRTTATTGHRAWNRGNVCTLNIKQDHKG